MRYLASFFITLFLYGSLISTLFYNFDNSFLANKNLTKKEQIVKISLVENIEKELPKKEEKPVIKKVKKVKKIKKIEKKEIKKQVIKSKKTVPKKKIKKVKKIIKNTPVSKNIKDLQEKKEILKQQQNIDKEKVKNNFIEKVKEKINKNKFYPKSARRRGAEGDVKVEFSILKNGLLSDLRIIEGKSIFYKAVKKSITDSFPVEIDNKIISFPLKITLKLHYTLN